jgi:hypothetical protein
MGAQYLTLSTVDFNARPTDDVVDTHNFKLLTVHFAQPNLICFYDIRIPVLLFLKMAKDSRNKWQIVLWNDINVRLLRRVQLAGNKYMLAAAYLLHISPIIATNLSSHRKCLALPYTSPRRPPTQYVTSSYTRNSTGIAQFLQIVSARPSSMAFCQQIPGWIPIPVLGLAALQHSPRSTHDSATFCHLLTCHISQC